MFICICIHLVYIYRERERKHAYLPLQQARVVDHLLLNARLRLRGLHLLQLLRALALAHLHRRQPLLR